MPRPLTLNLFAQSSSDQYTTLEAARTSLLNYAGTKVQALRQVLGEAWQAYKCLHQELLATWESISLQQHILAQAEAAERYFQLTLADEALACSNVVVCVRPQADVEKVLLLSGIPQHIGQMDG
ncbi:hypothetical protein FIBSPDRAFT_894018 [Athelia psychrophila]|uniref:Uncharacterized protein n=1 Tax=Athelia psychrophila TaxID=1759441 RepID=A0A166GFE9_9AGAM|nr:hypothetical protein FIBSPDRAFT_894018 [Fibularhizoctonia sp. CBS 109695]